MRWSLLPQFRCLRLLSFNVRYKTCMSNPVPDTYLTLCFRYEFVWNISEPNYFICINFKSHHIYLQWNNISFNREIDFDKIMRGRNCMLNFSVDRNEVSWWNVFLSSTMINKMLDKWQLTENLNAWDLWYFI